MLKTKLLSIFVAFALMITVGGVYATWNYIEGDISAADGYFDNVLKMAEVTDSSSAGSFSIKRIEDLSITIDDLGGDHIADLVFDGSLTIVFTPVAGVTDEYVESLPIQFTLFNHEDLVYPDGSDDAIFNVYTTPIVRGSTITVGGETVSVGDFTKTETGTYEWVIPASTFSKLITLSSDFELPTRADYDEFRSKLHDGSLSIKIEQVPEPELE